MKSNRIDPEYSIAHERYLSLIARSFDKNLDLFLFSKLSKNWKDEIVTPILDFKISSDNPWFKININVLKEYKTIYQNMTLVRNRNKLFNEWKKDEKEKIKKMKEVYYNYFTSNLSIEKFKEFYGPDNDQKHRKCHYCGIDEEKINLLIKNEMITTKRLYSRGKKLEVDKKEPDGEYSKENIILCCYWCNNAKTDEFTETEFKIIAEKIREVWQKRLDKINKYKIQY